MTGAVAFDRETLAITSNPQEEAEKGQHVKQQLVCDRPYMCLVSQTSCRTDVGRQNHGHAYSLAANDFVGKPVAQGIASFTIPSWVGEGLIVQTLFQAKLVTAFAARDQRVRESLSQAEASVRALLSDLVDLHHVRKETSLCTVLSFAQQVFGTAIAGQPTKRARRTKRS